LQDESPLLASVKELERALAALEDAVEHRKEKDRSRVDLDAEIHRAGADRSRLAQALDAAEARAARLEEANREVSRRLIAAMETIRTVLNRQRGPG
jgi:hypothetical protein